jgi:hypothetical protein
MVTEKLMTDETAASLEPLRRVLQLSGEEWREGVFVAWKGFLYYSCTSRRPRSSCRNCSENWLETRVKGATRSEIEDINAIRRRISCCLSYLTSVATDGVRNVQGGLVYKAGSSSTASGGIVPGIPPQRTPRASSNSARAFGMIMHVKSFWNFRFSNIEGDLEAEEAIDVFHDFDRSSRQSTTSSIEASGTAVTGRTL